MSYDLKRLREAIDREIPAPAVKRSESLKTCAGRRRRSILSPVLTAAAALILLLTTVTALLPQGAGQDRVHGREGVLSPGKSGIPRATQAPVQPSVTAVPAEDDVDYMTYSPDWAISAFPDRKECGEVVIRKTEEKEFVFEYEKSGQPALPGRWKQAFVYFPATGTGLVGDGKGMALLGKDGLITGYVYDSFQYVGGGAAIVALSSENVRQEGMYVQTLASAADGRLLTDRRYEEIGVARSDGMTFLLGNVYERTADSDPDAYWHELSKLYTDVMDTQGNLIVSGYEFWGYTDGRLWVQKEQDGGRRAYDLLGGELLNGTEFSFVGAEKWGMSVAWLWQGGMGVLNGADEWVIEPGTYFTVDIAGEDRFEVTDLEGKKRLVNAAGEDVGGWLFELKLLPGRIALWLEDLMHTMGRAGFALAVSAAAWLLIRWRLAAARGWTKHMLLTELGWALLTAGLILISHRQQQGIAYLWPTDTSTDGANGLALLWAAASLGGLCAMLGSWRRARKKGRAVLLGAAVLAGPWLIKAACSDMSVMEWRAASILIMGLLPAWIIVVWKSKRLAAFLTLCGELDGVGEYTRIGRRIWYALAAAALVHFLLGSLLSGQEMISAASGASVERGAAHRFDEAWLEETNALSGRYLEEGKDEEMLREVIRDGGWEQAAAVRWMAEQGIERLTGDMFITVRLESRVTLRRRAQVQTYLAFAEDEPAEGVLQLAASSPVGTDGMLTCESVFLLAPGKTLPPVMGRAHVTQPSLDWIASQRIWLIDMGEAVPADTAG